MVRRLSPLQLGALQVRRQREEFGELKAQHEDIVNRSTRKSPTAMETAEDYYRDHPDKYESTKLNQIKALTRRQRQHIRKHLKALATLRA